MKLKLLMLVTDLQVAKVKLQKKYEKQKASSDTQRQWKQNDLFSHIQTMKRK